MTARNRNEFLLFLVRDFICLKKETLVWAREDASGVLLAYGKLLGACMALELDYTETDTTCLIKSRGRRPRTVVCYEKAELLQLGREGSF